MINRIWRIRILHLLIVFLWIILAVRLVYMQFFAFDEYSAQARDNMIRQRSIPTARGMIYDCRGRTLARNAVNFVIKVVPSEMKDPNATLTRLINIVQLHEKEARELLTKATVSPQEPQLLKESLNDSMVAKVAEMQGENTGIYIDAKSWREYPLGAIGAHVLGYVGEISEEELAQKRSQGYDVGEWIGKDGVEYSHNSALHGQAGSDIYQVDVSGKEIRQVAEIPGYPGNNLYLSIDARLQRQAEAYLQSTLDNIYTKNGVRSGGAVVAIEPHTGYVRAMASLPDYNPNWFAKGISTKRFEKLINDKCSPLLNRAVCGSYPPGSTFKLVTTAAALQEGVITTGTWFYCPGVYYVEGLPFNCFVRSGHGTIDLIKCIAESCDVAYYRMGCQLGLKRMYNYAHAFGVGEKSGIDLPGETEGNFPSIGWKEKYFGEKWFPGDNANTSIGQGFVTCSPLQVAQYTAAVANGGTLYRPLIVEQVESIGPEGVKVERQNPQVIRRLPVRESYFHYIREGMRGTVAYGTASSYSGGIDMAGKTGTAENAPSADNPYGRNHTWFTGFAPVKDPRLVVTVFLEKSGGYGGNMAAPIAFNLAREWGRIQREGKKTAVKAVPEWKGAY